MAVTVTTIYTNLLSLHLAGGRVKPQNESYIKTISICSECFRHCRWQTKEGIYLQKVENKVVCSHSVGTKRRKTVQER